MKNTGRTVNKKILPAILCLFILFIAFTVFRSLYRAKECARMAVCISNLKQFSSACSQYANDFERVFPPDLSYLYPNYANSLDIFICPSRKPDVTESDVLNDFAICYEYISGLTKQDGPECVLLCDRKGNHHIGHNRGDRNVAFVGGHVQRIKKEDWPSVWQKHEMGLRKERIFEPDKKSVDNSGEGHLEEFSEILKSLDKTQPESINAALKIYKTLFPDDNSAAEEGFRLFRSFYKEVIRHCDRNFLRAKNLQNALHKRRGTMLKCPEYKGTWILDTLIWTKFQSAIFPEAITLRNNFHEEVSELEVYAENGISFILSEGDWYLVENNQFLLSEVLENYSLNSKRYIEFLVTENKKHPKIVYDGGLRITWDELRQRLLRWESFPRQFSDLKETENEIIPAIKWMLSVYLGGFVLDNSPHYEWGTREIRSDVKTSYEKFIKENNDSKYWLLVKKVYDVYESNEFVFSKEIEAEIRSLILREDK